jgi:predicted transposase YdaD
MSERLEREAEPGKRASLWMTTFLLMGLRFPAAEASELLQGVQAMRESTTYQAILEEGRLEGLSEGRLEGEKRLLALMGGEKFGPPDARTREKIDALQSIERIEELTRRLLHVERWEDLFS